VLFADACPSFCNQQATIGFLPIRAAGFSSLTLSFKSTILHSAAVIGQTVKADINPTRSVIVQSRVNFYLDRVDR
jgi:hypothetical protein